MVFSLLWLIISLFIIYQGLTFNGIIDLPMLVIAKFSSNNYLLLVREILGKYLLILGVFGIVASVIMLISSKFGNNEEFNVSKSFWGILIIYAVIAIFTVI